MKTTQEMIEVMKAYEEGKQIEVKNGEDKSWFNVQFPTWDWLHKDYRIKIEPTKKEVLPYESAEEFLTAQKEHGMYIKVPFENGDGSFYAVPDSVYTNCIFITDEGYELKSLGFNELTELTWQDGTPCGKEVEE